MKRTALGRFKHEAGCRHDRPATGSYVVYMGDDERFDYVYKFVTAGAVDPDNRANNMTCSTRARCTSPASTTTARAPGCRWSLARAR